MNETGWRFLNNPMEAWEAMLSDCQNARVSIDLNQYIFDVDGIGKKFLVLFFEKAKHGVRIRLLCDAVGSWNLYNSQYPKKLSEAGIQVMFFNPISPWRLTNFTSWFFRDHKKLLIVDSQIGHTGSLGVKFQMADWRDTNIRFTGPIVKSMEACFVGMWETTVKSKFLDLKDDIVPAPGFWYVTNSPILRPMGSQRHIRDSLIDAIDGARRYIYLTTSYFVPDWGFFRSLRLAARRGVEVILLLPEFSDLRSLDIAASSHFGLAFNAGIKTYRYQKTILHTKTAIIDDEWGSVGSANLDNLSFKFQYEANIVSTNKNFNRELKQQFLDDLQFAKVVSPFEWGKRPWRQKVLELLTWPAHHFM